MADSIAAFLRTTARQALIAKALTSPSCSRLLSGQGPPLGASNERWPTARGLPLLPVLSIYTPELPFVPEYLRARKYWSIFLLPDTFEQTCANGTLVIRSYGDIATLQPLPVPSSISTSRPRLKFRAVTDYPCVSTLRHVLRDRPKLLRAVETHPKRLAREYPCHAGIKLGGHPYLIQGTAFLQSLEPNFDLQIDATGYFTNCDSGIGYVYGGLLATIWETT